MSSTSSSAILELIQVGLIRYFLIVVLIFGTFGNTLNIYIFTRPKLRSIPCSWYFLASACSSLLALYMGCLTRVLITFGFNPETELGRLIYCKIRTYLTNVGLSLSIWLVIGACADRFASSCTSVRMRLFSNIKTAKRVIIAMTLIVYLVYSQMLYCFNSSFQSNTANCYTTSDVCELYNDFALLFTYSVLPAVLMLILGLLTIRNIRHTQRHVAASSTVVSCNQHTRKTTKQMTVMLFVQVICSVLLSLPISIEKAYTVLTKYHTKSIEQQKLEDFLNVLVVLISLVNSSLSFYIFTLTGQIFRQELKRIFRFKFAVRVAPLALQNTNQGTNVHRGTRT